jgi:hypothetical protein
VRNQQEAGGKPLVVPLATHFLLVYSSTLKMEAIYSHKTAGSFKLHGVTILKNIFFRTTSS